MIQFKYVCVLIFFGVQLGSINGQTFVDLLQREGLTEFLNRAEKHKILSSLLEGRGGTLFAPSNEAISQHGEIIDKLLFYHISNLAITSDKFERKMATDFTGNKPVWITKKDKEGSYDKEIYVNNAKIIRKDLRGMSSDGEMQVLHVIDQVLDVVLPTESQNNDLMNPDAAKFLRSSNSYKLENKITDFAQSVQMNDKYAEFEKADGYTFFLPVNKDSTKGRLPIDGKIIDAHIIPDLVLFTRISEGNEEPTLTYSEGLRVSLSLKNETDAQGIVRFYAHSNTHVGDLDHPKGVVIASVVKANIPVRNGVVHLIDRPLMLVYGTITQFLSEQNEGPMKTLFEFIRDRATGFSEDLMIASHATFFAPTNDAFRYVVKEKFDKIILDEQKLLDLMRLHLVNEVITSEDISKAKTQIFQATAHDGRKLYFTAIGNPQHPKITVEGGGVNASVVVQDIRTENGVIHFIDRILGIPFQSLLGKLATDAMLLETFQLGEQGHFNTMFDETSTKFTYFVPSNEAWETIKITMASTHKKLWMGDYNNQVKQILQRHLIIGEALTMEALADRTYTNGSVTMMRGEIKVKSEGGTGAAILRWDPSQLDRKTYTVEWEGEVANVIRPNVECMNGVIHVLDRVLMQERDVTVSKGLSTIASAVTVLLSIFVGQYFL